MADANKKNIDIHEYWQIFWKRKYYFIIPLILCTIIGLIWGIIAKPVYESSTVVQISNAKLLTDGMKKIVPGVMEKERYNNLTRLITSYKYLKRLINTLKLDKDPGMIGWAKKIKKKYPNLTLEEVTELLWLEKIRDLVTISPMGKEFIKLSAEASTPELAYDITVTLTQIFIDESLQREAGGISGAMDFSSQQLALYKKKLQESEERLQRFKENILNDQFNDNTVVASNLDKINAMLTTVDLDIKDAQDRQKFLENRINELGIFYYSPESQELDRLRSRVLEATSELSKVMLKYTWDDPEALKINLLIDDLRDKMRAEIEKDVKSQYSIDDPNSLDLIVQKEMIPLDVEFLERKKIELARLVKIFRTNVSRAPSRELSLNRLKREVEINRAIYSSFIKQTQGSEIEKALQKKSAEFRFTIVEPAIKPVEPIRPSRTRMLIMAIVVGSVIGIGIISLLESTDHSFKRVEEVEKFLNLPVLGTVPRIDMGVGRKKFGEVKFNG